MGGIYYMKNIYFVYFTIMIFFSCIFSVHASCTSYEIADLKEEADKIMITYKHLGAVVDEEGLIYYNRFQVDVKNVSDDLYILYLDKIKLIPENVIINDTFINGTYNFDIYSNKCEEMISRIKVHIPKFNIYSLDSLCNGISGEDFALCGKYYEYDVSYEDFVKRVNHYRSTSNIINDDNSDYVEEDNDENIFDVLLKYIIKYKFYIGIFLFLVLFIVILLMVIKKRRKMKVLE